jgi:hypothetical protein
MNASGICLAHSPLRTNAWMVNNWVKGAFTTLNVPSMYQVLDLFNKLNMFSVANTRLRRPSTFTSDCKKSAGMWSSLISKSRLEGSAGRFFVGGSLQL